MLESLEMNGFMLVVWIALIKQCARRNIFLIWLKDGITMLGGVVNERQAMQVVPIP
jgi:hypothetical protein